MRTRQHILEAAKRVLQTKGLAHLTNKEAAGCAEGTLYNHFETREAFVKLLPTAFSVTRSPRLQP